MREEFLVDEPELKLETLVRLQNVLRALLANTTEYKPISEMASFENFTRRVAHFEGWGTGMDTIWRGLMADYKHQLTEGDPFISWIKCWIGTDGNVGKTVRPGQIYADLGRNYGRHFRKTAGCVDAARFGRTIRKNLDPLATLGFKQTGNNGGPIYTADPTPDVLSECKQCYEETPHSALWEPTYDGDE